MFEMIFGLIWTIFMVIFTWGFYGTNGDVTVNGELVSHEEFAALLWPKLFIGLFWAIGLFMLFRGLRKIIKDTSTKINGEKCFGKICNIYNSGTYVNGRPELKADIFAYIPSMQETRMLSEVIGFDMHKYQIGSYVQLKYYDGDVNVEGAVDSFELPEDAKYELSKSEDHPIDLKDTIIVNGVEYIRKDLIDTSDSEDMFL